MQDQDWKQFFPTFNIRKRGVLFEEYRASIENIKASEQSFSFFANLAVVLVTASGSLLFAQSKDGGSLALLIDNVWLSLAILISMFFFTCLTASYIGNKIRSLLFEERKVVVLRVILGLDYGSQQLVLPIDRIEGATNPFKIKFFPSLFCSFFYPFWVFLLFFAVTSLFLLKTISVGISIHQENASLSIVSENLYTIYIASIISIILFFRKSLFDSHENFKLIFSEITSKSIFFGLIDNIGNALYRARLSRYESMRIGINLEKFYPILTHIEDRRFFKHGGFDIRAIVRAIQQYYLRKKRSGASTITQQLARTLFIADYYKTYRRKLVEILLATWLESILTKREIIDIYLSSVRFSKGVHGVAKAASSFFPDIAPKDLSTCHIFILIERIANIHDTLKLERINALLTSAEQISILNPLEVRSIKNLYYNLVISQKLYCQEFEKITDWNLSEF